MNRTTLVFALISAFAIATLGFSYAWAQADTQPPSISFIFPSASNGTEPANKTYIIWNASVSENISSCKFEINGTNRTGTAVNASASSYCHYNETGLTGNVTRCSIAHAADNSSNWNTTRIMVCRRTNEQQPADTAPPALSFALPTPPNGQVLTDRDWVCMNVSSSEPLASCILDWNGTNQTLAPSGTLCYTNKTGLAKGNVTYRVYASDPSGNMNATGKRNVSIDFAPPDLTLPAIHSYEILPLLIPFGGTVLIGVNASDDEGIDDLWANITDPSGEHHHMVLLNNQLVPWDTNVVGMYSITIFAEDTSFNVVNVSDSFYVNDLVDINITVLDAYDEGVSTDLEIYVTGTDQRVFSSHDSDGEFGASVVEHEYDMLFLAFDDQFEILFREVPLTPGFDGYLGLDEPGSMDGFEYVFAVKTDYPMDDARVRIYYEGMDFDNESNVHVYLCDDWDFDDRQCDSGWDEIEDAGNDRENEIMEFFVDEFSAFAIREDSWCGDGICGPKETVRSCPDDCECDEGDTRSCSVLHEGRCAAGTETCHSNRWSGCPAPIGESCNMEDDDCNNIIDDVDGGRSISATKCQCYNDGSPLPESCNGIDDNCDGLIDNGADCCTSGQERGCGPGTEEGECRRGTSTCSDGSWGQCTGAIYPEDEVCGDNKDNDCDGETDEGCQLPSCGEGEITQLCLCEASVRGYGYCCSGIYSDKECVQNLWWVLVIIGVALLIVLAILIIYFKSQGRELTWDELMNRYGGPPAGQPPEQPQQ
jgi:hypothetical protein